MIGRQRCLRRAAPTLVAGNRIWTLTRDNQHLQHSHGLMRFISRVPQRVEGVFHEIQNFSDVIDSSHLSQLLRNPVPHKKQNLDLDDN